jgi:predicted ATPase/DNA-binding winged helix-turn-helix (wHTH) protein
MTPPAAVLAFGPFRLVAAKRELWKEEKLLQLRPLPLAVLAYLVQHPGQVISIEEIRTAIWGDTRVGRGAIRVCVREIRQALGDEVADPQYIETVGRHGYRFLGARSAGAVAHASSGAVPHEEGSALASVSPSAPFIGRQLELARMQQWFAQVLQGQRHVVLVSGEPGIGKTTLIQQFVQAVAPRRSPSAPWIGHGQCVEAYGQGEAYLPLLEAIGRLGREDEAGTLAAVFHHYAPTWVAQLPGLGDLAARGDVPRHVAGVTQERMLRELCDALEILTATQPLLLVLEDLQWSDTATLAWLAAVARRLDPARLFVLGAYRPLEVAAQHHPLRSVVQELRAHHLCREVRLQLFSADEVQTYVHERFGSRAVAEALGRRLYQRTDGNPLFLTASVEALIQQGVVGQEDDGWVVRGNLAVLEDTIPEDLQQLITRQVEALSDAEQRLLEIASVSGVSFSTAEVAAGCQEEVEAIDLRCVQLARQGQFLAEEGVEEWPDGTSTLRYGFHHALYQQAVYMRLGSGQKVRLHRRIGERREGGYRERVGEIAGELAVHFEQARDYQRAVRYQQLAAEQALRRSGLHETMHHCHHGLALLERWPATPERARQELALRRLLAPAQLAVLGVVAEELGQNLERARIVCQEVGEPEAIIPVLIGLIRFYHWRGESAACEAVAEQMRHLLERIEEPALALQLHIPLGTFELWHGAPHRALEQYERVMSLLDPDRHESLLLSFSLDPLTVALLHGSLSAWLLGRPDHARTWLQRGLARAEEVAHPPTLSYALILAAMARHFLREPDEAWRLAQRIVSMAREHSFALFTLMGEILQSCGMGQRSELQVGLPAMAAALAAYRATGSRQFMHVFLALLTESSLQAGRIPEGLQVVAEALQLTATTCERFWEAELYRLKGALLLAQEVKSQNAKGKNQKFQSPNPLSEAEACFLKALEIAGHQQAKSLELRAATSLARLWQSQGKIAEAHKLVSEVYTWFTEGFDTKDLQEAKALLADLV